MPIYMLGTMDISPSLDRSIPLQFKNGIRLLATHESEFWLIVGISSSPF